VRRLLLLSVFALAALVGAGAAPASELIDRNATRATLGVDAKGRALLTYRVRGRVRRVLAWGAVNARPPDPKRKQIEFRLDYAGGWGAFRREYWKDFESACTTYDGPSLQWFVTGCRAADG
jgi:hypothetical protein